MDFMLALNVAIYGLGIVFLALLVLMVVIMLLSKVFSVATGRDLLPTPQAAARPASSPLAVPAGPTVALSRSASTAAATSAEAAEPVNAPLPGKILSIAVKAGDAVKKGDELCVIEAMKMGNSVKAPRDGFVVDVRVAQGASVAFGAPLMFLASTADTTAPRVAAPSASPSASQATVEPSAFTLGTSGKTHAVELLPAGGGVLAVLLDGTRYEVRRDAGTRHTLIVNGQAHTVEVKEVAGPAVTVVVDGRTEKLHVTREGASAPGGTAAVVSASVTGGGAAVTAPLPGKILSIAVKAGDAVKKGDELCVIEAMKMGNSVKAQRDGVVREVLVAPGQTVAFGASLVVLA